MLTAAKVCPTVPSLDINTNGDCEDYSNISAAWSTLIMYYTTSQYYNVTSTTARYKRCTNICLMCFVFGVIPEVYPYRLCPFALFLLFAGSLDYSTSDNVLIIYLCLGKIYYSCAIKSRANTNFSSFVRYIIIHRPTLYITTYKFYTESKNTVSAINQ